MRKLNLTVTKLFGPITCKGPKDGAKRLDGFNGGERVRELVGTRMSNKTDIIAREREILSVGAR